MGWISVFAGCAAAAVLALAPAAHADLKSYNAAVTKGDFAAASNEIPSTWAGLDRSRKDIFVIGREFGWTAMLAGKPVLARDVVGSLSATSVVDDAPEVTGVLLAWANFKVSGDAANRSKLFAALRARAQKPQDDLIALRAAQDLFNAEWTRDDMGSAAEAAGLGHKFAAELGDDMVDVGYTLRRFEAVAQFIQKPDRGDFASITALADEIEARLGKETNPKMREQLITALAHTLAWQGVEREVLRLRGRSVVDAPDPKDRRASAWYPVSGDPSIPVCRISLDQRGREPDYPDKARSKGLPGYAIYAFDTGEGGALTSARILGSAPHESFTKTIDEVLPVWRWRMADGRSEASCRRPDKLIVNFVFSFKRR